MENGQAWLKVQFDRYNKHVYRYARRYYQSEKAQDLVQFAFLKLFEHQDDEILKIKAWLFKVVRNKALTELKLDKREDYRFELEEFASLQDMETEYEKVELARLLEKLKPLEKETIILKYQEGMTYKEISTVLEISETNVGVILTRSIEKLGRIIKDQDKV